MRSLSLIILLFLTQWTTITESYCTGYLRNRDIAGIWKLTSKHSVLPNILPQQRPNKITYPMKEFTVYPKDKQRQFDKQESIKNKKTKDDDDDDDNNDGGEKEDIFLLLREDGTFVQYYSPSVVGQSAALSTSNEAFAVQEMKGYWALVDGKLILATERPKDIKNVRAEGHHHDTILEGRIVAVSEYSLVENPALLEQQQQQQQVTQQRNDNIPKENSSDSATTATDKTNNNNDNGVSKSKNEDVHLSVPKGKVKVGKFFYPLNHPSFFEQPIFKPMKTGSFELRQVLGNLNTHLPHDDDELVEKFRKNDLMDKRYFITSYPLPVERKRKQRWSIKYNKFVDAKPKSDKEKEREEEQKNAPVPIKTFEVDLFANNTFQTGIGLGDTILRGKWSIVGEQRDQLWMNVWRFGFGRDVSGSTFSEGSTLSQADEVAYWGKIYEVDVGSVDDGRENSAEAKKTKIEVNGSVMFGVGLEPCSVARFTMIEKTEEDELHDDDDDDDDDDPWSNLREDVGSFE